MKNKELKKIQAQREKAEGRLRYLEHQQKIEQKKEKELIRNTRTHRLCTRGGMLESFLVRPSVLSNGQVMKLLDVKGIIEMLKSIMILTFTKKKYTCK